MFYFSRFCKETIAEFLGTTGIRQFYFSRFCKETIAPDEIQTFSDTYSINTDYFYNTTEILDHIKNDLKLVAGGGYNTDHIHPVYFNIEEQTQ